MKINRLLSLILLLLLSFTFVSCNNNNTNGNDYTKPIVTLPNKNEAKEVAKDEVIYINMLGDGSIETMKATNRITNSSFAYYKDYGKFNSNDNLNITSPKGSILIEDNYALIPSLQTNDNMFYSLSLSKSYYEDKLPFNILASYKLENKEVSYEDLKGANGKVEIEFSFNPNNNANPYFLNNYAAQIQIPFNINNAKNIVAEGAMQNTLVGQTLTLVYMIMPNTSQTFTILLDASNFTFDGIQAVLQPFSLSSITSFLPIDLDKEINIDDLVSINLDNFDSFEDEFDLLLNFNEALSMFDNIDQLFNILNMIPNLDILEDQNIYKERHLNKMIEIVELKQTIDFYINSFSDFRQLLENLQMKILPFIDKYESDFIIVEDLFQNALELQLVISALKEEEIDLKNILANKEIFIPLINTVITNVFSIREDLNTLIQSFYFLADDLKPIVDDLKDVLLVLESVPLFQEKFTDLGYELALGRLLGWFEREHVHHIDQILTELQQLEQYQDIFDTKEATDLINEVIDLYKIEQENEIRNIDLLIIELMLVNEQLSVPKNDKLAVYDLVNILNILMDYVDFLPSNNEEVISFLDSLNKPPDSVQFIIKQRGI